MKGRQQIYHHRNSAASWTARCSFEREDGATPWVILDCRLQIDPGSEICNLQSKICNPIDGSVGSGASLRRTAEGGCPHTSNPGTPLDDRRVCARKTKRPRLDLSLGTSVDQPSPKCCSRTTLTLRPVPWNGSRVLRHGTNGEPWKPCFARKTKRPRLNLSLGTSVDQPSPKCCSRTTLVPTPSPVNGSPVPYMARKW
jgi:hypothetical protein